jgi:hypothetical protein
MKDDTLKARVQQVCQDIYDRDGKVETRSLIKAARPKDSPAHDGFTWDNRTAADRYREIEARKWIRVVLIHREPESEPERLINVPRIVIESADTPPDSETREGHYQVASVLIERPDEFARALNQAQIKLDAAKRAVDDLLKAAESTGRADQAAMIAQMSRATEMWADALRAMH